MNAVIAKHTPIAPPMPAPIFTPRTSFFEPLASVPTVGRLVLVSEGDKAAVAVVASDAEAWEFEVEGGAVAYPVNAPFVALGNRNRAVDVLQHLVPSPLDSQQ